MSQAVWAGRWLGATAGLPTQMAVANLAFNTSLLSEPVFPTVKMGSLQFLSPAGVTAMNSDNVRKGVSNRTNPVQPLPDV